MKLYGKLRIEHIEGAHQRGEKYIIHKRRLIDVEKTWKKIQEELNAKQSGNKSRRKRVPETVEESKRLLDGGDDNSNGDVSERDS